MGHLDQDGGKFQQLSLFFYKYVVGAVLISPLNHQPSSSSGQFCFVESQDKIGFTIRQQKMGEKCTKTHWNFQKSVKQLNIRCYLQKVWGKQGHVFLFEIIGIMFISTNLFSKILGKFFFHKHTVIKGLKKSH